MNHRALLACAFALAAVALATAAFSEVPSAPPESAPLTPEAIYLRAVRAMKDAPTPPYVTFRENIAGRNFTLGCSSDGMQLTLHHGDTSGAYDVSFRTSDGSAVSQPVGMPSAKPCPGALLQPAGAAISALGLPQASPSASPASDAAASRSAGPPIIAAVRVDGARYYHIDLVGREKLAENDVYHLKLTAYRDPDTHPLTDLYVDPDTFLIREARGEVSGHYVIASGRFAGIVDFDRVGNYRLVQHERFDVAANALLVHARMIASIDGSNFMTPSELPDVVFPTPVPTATAKSSPSPRPT